MIYYFHVSKTRYSTCAITWNMDQAIESAEPTSFERELEALLAKCNKKEDILIFSMQEIIEMKAASVGAAMGQRYGGERSRKVNEAIQQYLAKKYKGLYLQVTQQPTEEDGTEDGSFTMGGLHTVIFAKTAFVQHGMISGSALPPLPLGGKMHPYRWRIITLMLINCASQKLADTSNFPLTKSLII